MNETMMLLVLAVAQNVSQTPYDELRYNCWDYATDMRSQLLQQGVKARIVFGVFNRGAHAWIDVDSEWFEPEIGQIIADRKPYRFGYYAVPKYNPWKKAYMAEAKK